MAVLWIFYRDSADGPGKKIDVEISEGEMVRFEENFISFKYASESRVMVSNREPKLGYDEPK